MTSRRDVPVRDAPPPTLAPSWPAGDPAAIPPRRAGPHVILFLAANPAGSDQLRLGKECAEIQRILAQAPHRDDFRFEARWAVTVDDLVRCAIELEPTILHFSGHGGGHAGLMLEDDAGLPAVVPAHALSRMIVAAAPHVRVVVFNACYTTVQAAALQPHVDCVVGMAGAIGDTAARSFALHFYGALGSRRSIGNAVDAARAVLSAKHAGDAELPACVTRDGVDPYRVVLEPIRAAPPRTDSKVIRKRSLRAVSSPRPPRPGTTTFVGRDRELAEIAALLEAGDAAHLPIALCGLPGVGKTELARQAVARRDRSPGGVLWFSAELPDLRQQWARLAIDLDGPDFDDLGERAAWAVRQIEARAERGEDTLIVLDHVESWDPPPGPLPGTATIRLLVTTRLRSLDNSFRCCQVDPLAIDHARALLHAIVGAPVPDADPLLELLAGHVLSIELAATYLRELGGSAKEYLDQLAAGERPDAAVAAHTSYRATAHSAFHLLWQRLDRELQAAWLLAAQLPAAWFSAELAAAIGLDAARRRGLLRLQLLERDRRGRHQMHRLLREFALAQPGDHDGLRAQVAAGMTRLLGAGDPALAFQRYDRDADGFSAIVAALPDGAAPALQVACGTARQQLGDLRGARALYERALAGPVDPVALARGRLQLVTVLEDLAETPAAEAICEQALDAALAAHAEHGPEVAAARAAMAAVLHELGELARARGLFEQALAAELAIHGDAHAVVAARRAELAAVLQQQGELVRARALFDQALDADRRSFGEPHPIVAVRRASLAGLLRQIDQLDDAQRLYEQALASDLASYGEHHRMVASRRAELARLLQQRGALGPARELYEQALASDLATYGADHPVVAARRASLAGWYLEADDLDRALALYQQAFAVELARYGHDHPTVATTRANLALVHHRRGDTAEARRLYEAAIEAGRETYGDDHPVVAAREANLATLLLELGDLSGARMLYTRALAIAVASYPDGHSVVAKRRANLATVLRRLGELEPAGELYQQAIDAAIHSHGEHHPDVAVRRANLAALCRTRGDLPRARVLYEQALASAIASYGPHHATVAIRRENLAQVQRELGAHAEARALYREMIASACASWGDDHPSAVATRARLAPVLRALGEPDVGAPDR